MSDLSMALRTLAEALPSGTPVPVPREHLLTLLDGVWTPRAATTTPTAIDQLLTAQEASKLLGVSPQWLYKSGEARPFKVHVGRRAIRFSKAKIERWVTRRTGMEI